MRFKSFVQEDKIDNLANQAATSPKNDLPEPTDDQKKSGKYKKGKLDLNGFKISIENPAGSYRSGTDPNGKTWKTKLYHHYGYIEGTKGKDKDALDVFIGSDHKTKNVFVANQKNDKGDFDEHKILMGFNTYSDASKGYLKNYETGWEAKGLLSSIHMTNVDGLKDWIKNGNVNKPFEGSLKEEEATELKNCLLERKLIKGWTKTTGGKQFIGAAVEGFKDYGRGMNPDDFGGEWVKKHNMPHEAHKEFFDTFRKAIKK